MKKLDGKVAIVSGSGRGIGRAVALKLGREDARVVVNDLDETPAEGPEVFRKVVNISSVSDWAAILVRLTTRR